MEKFKLNTVHYVLIGIIIGMCAVFGAFAFLKEKLTPKDVPELYAQERQTPENVERCPVCHKPVNPAGDFYVEIAGKRFNCCGNICKKSFLDDPSIYLKDLKVKIDIQVLPSENEAQNYREIPVDDQNTGEERSASSSSNSDYSETPDSSSGSASSPPPANDSGSSDIIDNIPMPDEIPLKVQPSSPPSGGSSNDVEEINLEHGGSPASPPSPSGSSGGEAEELKLDVPDEAPSQAPSQAPSDKRPNDMVIEEIPLY